MEELNYFTGEFSESELKNHFDSLDENKLKHELENFTNQYSELSEEEQLKYAGSVLFVCMNLIEKIGKTTAKNILVTLNKILLNNVQLFDWFENFEYFIVLYRYLFFTKEYEEYSILFEDGSYFLRILELVLDDGFEEAKLLAPSLLTVFYQLFNQNSLPEDRRIYFKRKYESLIRFIFENNGFEDAIYAYFRLDEVVSLFQFEHLKIINNYYIKNPQSDYVGKYLDFVSRHFNVVIKDSIDVVRKIAEENDSDIIRNQAIKLIEKYDNDYLNEKSDSESISSLDANQLLEQADKIIYYIRYTF